MKIFGISSDYILYSGTFAKWEKIEKKLKDVGVPEETIQEIHPDYLGGLVRAGQEDWQRGYRHGLTVHEPEIKYQILPTATKKIIDNVVKILESGNETMIDALKANVKAFLEIVESKKCNSRGGD